MKVSKACVANLIMNNWYSKYLNVEKNPYNGGKSKCKVLMK